MLDLLHHRLVVEIERDPKRKADLNFVTWAAHAYEAGLRPRIPGIFRKGGVKKQSATLLTDDKQVQMNTAREKRNQ